MYLITKKINPIHLPLIVIIGFLFLITGCDDKRIFEENTDIPDNNWNINNKVKFDVSIKDPSTAAKYNEKVRKADGKPNSNH